KRVVLDEVRGLKAELNQLQHEKGRHWRERIFEKEATESDWEERRQFGRRIEKVEAKIRSSWQEFRVLDDEQKSLVGSKQFIRIRARRKDIALEAEMMRLRLIREAYVAT